MSKNHIKFPSIGGFANMVKFRDRFRSKTESANFGTKIKLHGTNAGIRIKDGDYQAQSRGRDINVGSDNYGFANWVDLNWTAFAELIVDSKTTPETFIVFGEWAGEGIQQSVAVSKIPKAFYIFAICVMKAGGSKRYIVEPREIAELIPDAAGMDNLHILPWFSKGQIVFEGKDADLGVDALTQKQWTGKFLSWVMQDIMKESVDERAELEIEWRLWAGILSKGAREWFLAKCEEV